MVIPDRNKNDEITSKMYDCWLCWEKTGDGGGGGEKLNELGRQKFEGHKSWQ